MRSKLEQECSLKMLAERQAQLDKQQSLLQHIQALEEQLSHGTKPVSGSPAHLFTCSLHSSQM